MIIEALGLMFMNASVCILLQMAYTVLPSILILPYIYSRFLEMGCPQICY